MIIYYNVEVFICIYYMYGETYRNDQNMPKFDEELKLLLKNMYLVHTFYPNLEIMIILPNMGESAV